MSNPPSSPRWDDLRRRYLAAACLFVGLLSSIGLLLFSLSNAALSNAHESAEAGFIVGWYGGQSRQTLSCRDIGPVIGAETREHLRRRLSAAGYEVRVVSDRLRGTDYLVELALPESVELAHIRREEWAARGVHGAVEQRRDANALVIGSFTDEASALRRLAAVTEDVEGVDMRSVDREVAVASVLRVFNAPTSVLRAMTNAPTKACFSVAGGRWFL